MQSDTTDARKKLQRKEKELSEKKQRLLDMRLSGELTQDEFLEQKNRIIEELQEIKGNLLNVDSLDDSIIDGADTIIEFCTNLLQLWKSADLSQKIDIIKLLVGNLFIDENNKMTFRFYPLWEATYEINKSPHLHGDFDVCSLWLPNVVGSSNSPLSRIIPGLMQEARRSEQYRRVLYR